MPASIVQQICHMNINDYVLPKIIRQLPFNIPKQEDVKVSQTKFPAPEDSVINILKPITDNAMLDVIQRGTTTKRATKRRLSKAPRCTPLIATGSQMGCHDGSFEIFAESGVVTDEVRCKTLIGSLRKEASQTPVQEFHWRKHIKLNKLKINCLLDRKARRPRRRDLATLAAYSGYGRFDCLET